MAMAKVSTIVIAIFSVVMFLGFCPLYAQQDDRCKEAITIENGTERYYKNVRAEGDRLCDQHQEPGWYGYKINGTWAEIPTECLKEKICATDLGLTLDIDGQNFPASGENITAKLSAAYKVLDVYDCGIIVFDTVVLNCGDHYVYEIKQNVPDRCDVSVCLKKPGEVIEYDYLGNPPSSQAPTIELRSTTLYLINVTLHTPTTNGPNVSSMPPLTDPHAVDGAPPASSKEAVEISTTLTIWQKNSDLIIANIALGCVLVIIIVTHQLFVWCRPRRKKRVECVIEDDEAASFVKAPSTHSLASAPGGDPPQQVEDPPQPGASDEALWPAEEAPQPILHAVDEALWPAEEAPQPVPHANDEAPWPAMQAPQPVPHAIQEAPQPEATVAVVCTEPYYIQMGWTKR